MGWIQGIPPSPPSLKTLEWRGFRKNGLQDLEPQGFRGQNIDNKGLMPLNAFLERIAFALSMICAFNCVVKVRCHINADIVVDSEDGGAVVDSDMGPYSFSQCRY